MDGLTGVLLIAAAGAVVVVGVVACWALSVYKWLTVYEFEQAVRYVDGRLVGVAGPGRYFYNSRSTSLVKVDLRPSVLTVAGQEILTSDSVSLRLSLTVQCRIVDAVKSLSVQFGSQAWVYNAVQTALRDVTSSKTIADLLERRAEIGPEVFEKAAEGLKEVGVELGAVSVKDTMLPGEFKKAFAQVVVARQEGLAALERARGETAALRHLANASKLLDDNPALMKLRALEALEKSGGSLVLGQPPTV